MKKSFFEMPNANKTFVNKALFIQFLHLVEMILRLELIIKRSVRKINPLWTQQY